MRKGGDIHNFMKPRSMALLQPHQILKRVYAVTARSLVKASVLRQSQKGLPYWSSKESIQLFEQILGNSH